ncbi:MAG TPA: translocation/assembly module TamB domain-containing protein [Vicinamibacterales bacterium]|nr:translocation/assembly module TamB domain-containing protein [Vicinamibacterales bacterium]
MTRKRRIVRGLRMLGVLICALVIVALIALHTPPARRYVANQIVTLLAREQIEFSTDQLGYNVLNASVNLRNIRVRSTTWPEAPVFATIGRAQVNLSLVQLFRGRYVVESGTIDDVEIHYFVDEQGRNNLPRPPRDPDAPERDLDYLISSLAVARASVRYENRAEQIDARLPISSVAVSGNDLTDRHEIQFDAANGEVRIQDRQAAIDRLSGQVDLGEDDVAIEKLALDSAGSRAEVTGSIAQFDAPVADLAVKSSIDAAMVAPLARLDDPVSGTVAVDATVKGPLSTPAVLARVSSPALQFRELSNIQLDADGSYDVAARRAEVSALRVRGPWGGVSGTGNVALDGLGQSRMSAAVENLDAGAVMRALRLSYVAATRINGKVQAEWPGLDYLRARGTADATLQPTASEMSRSAMPLGGRLVARGTGSQIETQLIQLAVPGGEVNGRVAVGSDRRLQGDVSGRSEDVGQLTSSIEAFTGRPRGSLLPTPITGPAEVDARLAGSVSAPTATATLHAPALQVGMADGLALDADVSYEPRALTITRADLAWEEAAAHVDGRIGLGQNEPIDLRFSAENLDVTSLLQTANQNVPVTGTLSARGTVNGTTTRPVAMIAAQGSNLVAYEEQIGSLNADVRLDGRELTVSEVVVDKPQPDQAGRITATGTYHLDRRSYTFDLQSQDVRLVGLLLPDGRRIRGDVQQLAARGSGSISSPEGTVDVTIDSLEIVRPEPAAAADESATNPIQLGRLVINVVAMNNEATITASAARFNLDANGLVGLMRPWPTTVKVRADNLELAALPIQAASSSNSQRPSRLDGQLRATIDASGNLTEPAKGRATIALDALEGMWNGRPFTVTSPSPIQYADERLTVEKVEVAANDVSLTVTGELPLTDEAGTGAIDVDLHGSLATLTQYLPQDTNIAGDGAVALTGSLRGTLRRIDPNLTLTIDNGLILSPLLEPGFSRVFLRARVENGEADVEQLTANWGTATLQASGRIPLEILPELPVEIPRMGGPATFKAAVTGLDPSAIPGAPPQLSGRISAEADVKAAGANLSAFDGQITFQELDVAFGGLNLAQQQLSTIAIASGTATIEQLDLSGSAGEIHANGSVRLVDERALNVNVDGKLNVAAASLLTDQIRAEGDSTLMLTARGTIAEPDVTGAIEVMNARAVSDEPNVAADNINAHIDLEGRRIVLARLDADVNGGTLTGKGSLTIGEDMLSDVNLDITASDIAYDAPLNLRSVSDSTIKVTRSGDEILVSGQVTIDEAGLTEDLNFDTGLLASMTARRRLDLTEERNPILERVRFNIDVNTSTPIIVDNNLARAEIESDLTVVGTPYETGLLGELVVLEGSEIRLNERRYEAERGVLTFTDERRIFPAFDLRLNTRANTYDVTIEVTGTPGDTETTLTSSPSLPEPDIMALLVTGRTLEEMRGEEYEVARAQVLSYLAGRVGSGLGRGIQQATGLSEVRIEPTLIANESDPSARLTVGQNLTDDLKLVYSTNLTDSNDQIWVAEYDVTRRFQTRGVRQEDNSYRFDFQHDVRFGGLPEPRRTARVQPDIVDVTIVVPAGTDEAAVRERFGVEVGDTYDFFEIRNGIQRVEESLIEQGYLQSRVRLERGVEGNQARLTLRVVPGPRVDLQFMGATPPSKVAAEVRTRWHRGVFDKQRADDGVDTLRSWLMNDNHLQAKVEYQIQEVSDSERRVVYQIEPGARSSRVVLAFEGASGIDPDALDKVIEEQQLERQLFTDPLVVTELLERYYREEGFLAAEIDEPRHEFQGTTARVVLQVREGPRFTVRNVGLSGNSVYTTDAIASQLPVVPGESFVPAAAENALEKIRDLYWAKGYNDVRSDYEIVQDPGGTVDLSFTISEGRQSVIAGITIEGNDRVSNRLVSEQIRLATAQPLDLGALARSRRNLYDTGAFSVVDIRRRDVENAPATEAGANGAALDGSQASSTSADSGQLGQPKPVEINVAVREVQPIQIRYGASYDTERGLGGIFDISNHNSLGGAREIGLRSRYDSQLHEGRLYLNQPALNYLPETTFAIYLREELNPPTEITDPFDVSRRGISIQQEKKLRDAYVLTYGYRLERAHTITPVGGGLFLNEAVTVSPLTTTVTRETRDEVLDATRGSFLSQSFSFSPSALGSELPYIKYFGQYFYYFPLRPPTRRPFTNEMIRPRLVFATGVRIGLAWALGGSDQPVPRTERFYAGGSATMRGFAQNALGPIGLDRTPLGGEAMLVLNNELRVPLVSIVDGVAFVDIGNVYPTVRDFSFTDIRQSVGIGLRVRTPWVLLRGDYGFVIDPRPGEPSSRFYFSIGQAF